MIAAIATSLRKKSRHDDDKPRLSDRVRQQIRLRNYSIRTEAAYAEWINRYIRLTKYRRPAQMGAVEVEAFLDRLAIGHWPLAIGHNVAPAMQNQALAALLFLYKKVLKLELPLA